MMIQPKKKQMNKLCRCVIVYDDNTTQTVMKTSKEQAETWKLLIRPLIKEANIHSDNIPLAEDIGDEEWGRLDNINLTKYRWKYFSLIPEQYHEDVTYYPVRRALTV